MTIELWPTRWNRFTHGIEEFAVELPKKTIAKRAYFKKIYEDRRKVYI